MGEWRTVTLGDICQEGGGSIQTGPFGSQLHASDYVDHGTPSVMPQNIGDNRIIDHEIARVSDADMSRLRKYWLEPGDIVYSRRGDVERRALVRAENSGWLCGTGCLRVRVGDPSIHDSRFVSYALGLETSRHWISRHAVGATMLNLNTSILSSVPLRIPRITIQRAIAEVLGALDDKIAANESLSHRASELMRTLGSTATSLTRLSDLAVHETQSLRPSAFAEQVSHFSIPAFDAGAVAEVVEGAAIKSNKFVLRGPRVLVAKLNPRIPRVWNVSKLPESMSLASTEFVVLAPRDVSTSALWAVLNQPAFLNDLRSRVAGTSGSHQRVRPAEMLDATVPDPRSLTGSQLDSIDALGTYADQIKVENQQLATTRDELLPLLMSGKVRVRDAETIVEEAV